MSDKKYTPEEALLYRIVENWGNALCPMGVMEQWLKDYAKALHPSESAGVSMRPEDHEQVEVNIASGMSEGEASFQSGYTAGHDAGYAKGKRESTGASAVWVKGRYDQLYDQVKAGKQTVCYVDYNPWGTDRLYRDICTIRAETMEFSSRGHGYGTAKFMSGNERDLFIQLCESMNVEWLKESPSLSPDQSGKDKWDSIRMIGRVQDRFKELEHYGWNWKSFYNGWLEGRSDMFAQIKGIGQYSGKEDAVAEIKRRNKIIEDNLKLGMRLNMPGISEQEQEQTWQEFKQRNNL